MLIYPRHSDYFGQILCQRPSILTSTPYLTGLGARGKWSSLSKTISWYSAPQKYSALPRPIQLRLGRLESPRSLTFQWQIFPGGAHSSYGITVPRESENRTGRIKIYLRIYCKFDIPIMLLERLWDVKLAMWLSFMSTPAGHGPTSKLIAVCIPP